MYLQKDTSIVATSPSCELKNQASVQVNTIALFNFCCWCCWYTSKGHEVVKDICNFSKH